MLTLDLRGKRSKARWLGLFALSGVLGCGLETAPKQDPAARQGNGSSVVPDQGGNAFNGVNGDDHRVLEAIITPSIADGGTKDSGTKIDAGSGHDACGDGVLDQGEVCDPGLSACCDETCDGPKKKGQQCRKADGACDVAELCDGSAIECPDDAVMPDGHECRESAGECDVAEICDGKSNQCPDDGFKATTVRCRDAEGECDAAENCSGESASCPADGVASTAVRCRDAIGDCDVAEHCDGASKTCPPDGIASQGTECRASPIDALCDLPEVCDGASKDCPPATTAVAPPGYVCRKAVDLCDAPEQCDGLTTQCPSDKLQPMGSSCRASVGNCDVADVCDGQTAACPDVVLSTQTRCRGVANGDLCDVEEFCNGASGLCPADVVAPPSTVCRPVANGDDCDIAEHCDGSSKACPNDAVADASQVCRPKNGVCDTAENCAGGKRCPTDGFANTGVCRAVNVGDDCDLPESCDGRSANCPSDAVYQVADRQVCRPVNGVCDVAENCNGGKTCPSDGFANGKVCRNADPTDLCDAPETCDGSSGSCPTADKRLADGAACNGGLGKCSSDICCPGVTKASATSKCALPVGRDIVFVSSADHNGAFAPSGSGFAAADKLCTDLAGQANLAGTYHAWLSGSVSAAAGINARDRISSGPYVRVDGALVASNLATLTNAAQVALQNPISIAETGAARANAQVWTSSGFGGTGDSLACSNWINGTAQSTAGYGMSGATDGNWTEPVDPNGGAATHTCDTKLALYCFQDDCPNAASIDFANDPKNCGSCGNVCKTGQRCITGLCGNYVFVTSSAYSSSSFGGVPGADKQCQTLASQGKIPGGGTNFTAWISDSNSLAASRLVDGAYFRLDKKPVAGSLGELLKSASTPLQNPINVDETGATVRPKTVWTGTSAAGKLAVNCSDWAGGNTSGMVGVAGSTDGTWTQNGAVSCGTDTGASLYCFETDPQLIR